MTNSEQQTKKELIKSTSIVGGAQVFNIVLSVVRTKIVALLLGPSGLGVLGMLQSIVDMSRNVTGFGINFSSVKDIAEAAGSGDTQRIAITTTILRRWAVMTGVLGFVLTAVLSFPLSQLSFDSSDYTWSIVVAAFSLIITSVSAAQIALLQGLRRIGQMAKASLWGAVVSTAVVIPIYWLFGVEGIPVALVCTAFGALGISWIYARKAKIKSVPMTLRQTIKGGLGMAKLGFFIVVSGSIGVLTMYLTRIIVVDKLGLDGVGYLQAVWMITNIYLNIVLNAMLADFFPRLSAINTDNAQVRTLVNLQLELALLAGIILMALMIAFAPLALNVLYSSKFDAAIPLLQWQMLGSITTFVAWPLGVIFLAKSKGHLSVVTDAMWCGLYLVMVYFGWDYFGFNIIGIAYVVASVIKAVVVILITKRISNFSFTSINLKYMAFGVVVLISIFIFSYSFDQLTFRILGGGLALVVTGVCLREINKTLKLKSIVTKIFPRKHTND